MGTAEGLGADGAGPGYRGLCDQNSGQSPSDGGRVQVKWGVAVAAWHGHWRACARPIHIPVNSKNSKSQEGHKNSAVFVS